MAKARMAGNHAEHIDIHEDDTHKEDPEETMDESMDPLEESGFTVDSSDEEVEDSVQEDMARFEETFVGINKRFRLINRIGEGMFRLYDLQQIYSRLTYTCRYILNCLQSRGSRVQQVQKQLGH